MAVWYKYLRWLSTKLMSLHSQKGDFKIIDTIKIPVFTINDIIKKYYKDSYPDFLTLDAEGIDELIIESLDFNVFTPKVICIETIEFKEHKKNYDIIDYIVSKGYIIHSDTYINTIFVREELWVNRFNN